MIVYEGVNVYNSYMSHDTRVTTLLWVEWCVVTPFHERMCVTNECVAVHYCECVVSPWHANAHKLVYSETLVRDTHPFVEWCHNTSFRPHESCDVSRHMQICDELIYGETLVRETYLFEREICHTTSFHPQECCECVASHANASRTKESCHTGLVTGVWEKRQIIYRPPRHKHLIEKVREQNTQPLEEFASISWFSL